MGGSITALADRVLRLARMDHHLTEVVRGASVAFVLRVFAMGLGFAFNVLLARLVGAEGTGVYYLALTVMTIATVVGSMGMDSSLLRFTAANAEQRDWEKVAGACRQAVWFVTVLSLLFTVVVVVGAPWISDVVFSEPDLTGPLRIMAVSIVPMSLLFLYGEFLKGLKKIRDATLVQSVGVPVISLPLFALLGGSLGVAGAAIAYAVACVLMFLLGVVLWRRAAPQIRGVRGGFDTRLLVRTSLPLFWVASMNLVMTWTDTIMIGIWLDSEAVGIYGVAIRMALLTSFILVAVNSIVAPKFAALHARGDRQALGSLAIGSAKLMTLVAAPILLLYVFAPGWILETFFGPEFRAGSLTLAILALGQFVNVAAGSVGNLLIMTGHERVERNIAVSFVCLNALLNLALIPPLGIVGAALSTSFSLALRNVIAYIVARRIGLFGK